MSEIKEETLAKFSKRVKELEDVLKIVVLNLRDSQATGIDDFIDVSIMAAEKILNKSQ